MSAMEEAEGVGEEGVAIDTTLVSSLRGGSGSGADGGQQQQPKRRKQTPIPGVNYSAPVQELNKSLDVTRFAQVESSYNVDSVRSTQRYHDTETFASVDFWMAVFIYIPAAIWSPKPKTFSSLDFAAFRMIAPWFQLLLQLMFYCVAVIDGCNTTKHLPRCRLAYELVLAKGSSIHEPDGERRYAGRRFRFIAPKAGKTFGKVLEQLIERNAIGRAMSNKTSTKSDQKRPKFTDLTQDMWKALCHSIGNMDPMRAYTSIADDVSAWNPINVFNLERSLLISMAAASKSNPVPCQVSRDILSYVNCRSERGDDVSTDEWVTYAEKVSNWKSYIFPHDGALTWNILLGSINVNNWRSTQLPEVEKIYDQSGLREKQYWTGVAARGAALLCHHPLVSQRPIGWESSHAGSIHGTRHIDRIFDEEVNSQPVPDTAFTMNSMTDECKKFFREAYIARVSDSLEDLQTAHRRGELRSFKQTVDRMFHAGATLNPPGKAMVAFYQKYMDNHYNLSMPRANEHANLSSFENLLIQYVQAFDALGKVYTVHRKILSFFIASCYTYSEDKMFINHLQVGPPGTSKSEAYKFLAKKMLVDNTCLETHYTSDKAITGMIGDHSDPSALLGQDEWIRINDEASNSELGIQTGSGAAATAGSTGEGNERASQLKAQISDGEYGYDALNMEEGGVRRSDRRVVKCRGTWFYAANTAAENIPVALLSRFLVEDVSGKQRDDITLDALMAKAGQLQGNQKASWEAVCQRAQLTHFRCWMVWKCYNRLGFPPIDTSAVDALVSNVKSRLARSGLGINKPDQVRNGERLSKYIRQLVVMDAIDTVFDGPTSHLKDRLFHPYQLIELKKHLVAKTRHATIAFGLCARQWEDPIRDAVQAQIVQWVKENKTKIVVNTSLGHGPGIPQSDGVSSTVHTRYTTGIPGAAPAVLEVRDPADVKHDNEYEMCKHEFVQDTTRTGGVRSDVTLDRLVTSFAHVILRKMTDQPTVDAVASAIRKLLGSDMTIPSRVEKGQEKLVKALRIRQDAVEIPYTMLDGSYRAPDAGSVIKKALTEELNHRHARQSDYIYGAALSPQNPTTFDVISVKEGGDGKSNFVFPPSDTLNDTNIDSTNALNDGAQDNAIEPTEVQPHLGHHDACPSTPVTLTSDLDDYATRLYNAKISLSPYERRTPPLNDTFQEKDNWWRSRPRNTKPCLPYPACDPTYDYSAYIGRHHALVNATRQGLIPLTGANTSDSSIVSAEATAMASFDQIRKAFKRKRKPSSGAVKDEEGGVAEEEEEEVEEGEDGQIATPRRDRLAEITAFEKKNPFEPDLAARNDYQPEGWMDRSVARVTNPLYNHPDYILHMSQFKEDKQEREGKEEKEEKHPQQNVDRVVESDHMDVETQNPTFSGLSQDQPQPWSPSSSSSSSSSRVATQTRRKATRYGDRPTSSIYKGVSWDASCNRWIARISVSGSTRRRLGAFDNEREAAIAYDRAALEQNPVLACTNQRLGLL